MTHEKCPHCGDQLLLTDEQGSNMAFVRIDSKGHRCLGRRCYDCSLRHQRAYRKAVANAVVHRYEKTKKGFLMRLYRNMQSRVTGVQKLKAHLYGGKFLLPREDFYRWAMRSAKFHRLFTAWEESTYSRKLCPTVDRIDSSAGYELTNMRWLTHSQNSARRG